jgi:hypothetical protein
MTPRLDTIYTADEAAKRLRLTTRGVIKLAKEHGLCSVVGRTYLFTEKDLISLVEVTRAAQRDAKPRAVKADRVIPYDEWRQKNAWLFRPAVDVDLREMEILRSIAAQKAPRSHKQIERAGPRTIERLLHMKMVMSAGIDSHGNIQVSLSEEGRRQIGKVDKWIEQREAHGRSGGNWARHRWRP